MLDPVSLAAGAVALVKPLLAAAAKKFAEKTGESAFEGARKVMTWLRGKQSEDKNGSVAKALDRLALDPQNSNKEAALRIVLAEFLETDSALQRELGGLLEESKRSVQTASVQGNENVTIQAQGSNQQFNVNQK